MIKQHDALNTIYSNAINTLRLETFRGKDHKVQLLGAFMRFGTGGIEVDNGSSGGFFVNLDMKQGTLSKKARNKLVHSSNSYTKHPDTGITFENFKIPYFNEAINLVLKLGEMLPCYVHGWDLAITNDGPLIIEGNHSPGILNSELSYYGFKQHKAFVEIMGDIKSMNNS